MVFRIDHHYPALLRSASEVNIAKGNIAIIIVVEHRNIDTTLALIRGDLPNAIIIMVNLPSMSNVPRANRLHSRLEATQRMLLKSS